MNLVQECAQGSHWAVIDVPSSDGEKVYQVLVPPDAPEDVICPCPSFAHRGYCRHTTEALNSICHWAEDTSTHPQTPDQKLRHICPWCGGPTQVVAIESEEV